MRLLNVPVQLRPSPIYPGLHEQTCDPSVLLQVAFTWHLSGYAMHSSISFKIKEKKREKNEKWDLVFIQESYKYMYEKSRILVCNFLVSCDSRAGPVSQTAILEIFSRRYSKYHLKHTLLTALIMPREHKTRHTNNERENERKEIIHDRISLLFRIHLCNFFHFQYIQADNRIHVIQWCCGSLHSRDKSGFLYTRQRL